MKHAVYCLADDIDHARLIITAMIEAGINNDEIVILASHKKAIVKLINEYNKQIAYSTIIYSDKGTLLGWLRHLHQIIIPGVGLLFACDDMIKRISARALSSHNGSRPRSAIKEMGVTNDKAYLYEEALSAGYILVASYSANKACVQDAVDNLQKLDAQEIGNTSIASAC